MISSSFCLSAVLPFQTFNLVEKVGTSKTEVLQLSSAIGVKIITENPGFFSKS